MKIMVGIAALLLVLLTGPAGPAAAQEKIRIGVIQPLTGPTAYDGQRVLKGIKLYADRVNREGGVLDRPVELVIADNQNKPQESVSAFERLVTQDRVSAIIGCWASSNTLAVMPRLDQAKVPLVVETSTSPKVTAPGAPGLHWAFRLLTHSGMEARAHARYLTGQGFKKVGFIALNNDWGLSIIKEFGAQVRAAGAQVVGEEKYQAGEQNFLPFLSKAKAAGADAIFINGDTQSLSLMVKQAREQGLKATLIVATAGDLPEIIRNAGPEAAEGLYSIDYYDMNSPGPVSQEFVKLWTAAYPGESPSHQGPASGYSAMMLIVDAIRRARSAEPAKIREALETARLETPLGLIDFDQNHQAHPYSFLKIARAGKVDLLKAVPTR
jgi:branched-chain amino acid transport system substrate-binding protein